jgi:hypothetical protein
VLLGYITQKYLATEFASEVADYSAGLASTIVSGEELGVTGIFFHNITFFIIVSLLPLIGSLIYAAQFFVLGGMVFAIHQERFGAQVVMLYRHAALESIAIILAVTISYMLLYAVKAYNESADERGRSELVRTLASTLSLYAVIVALTFAGALLEGSAVVHL